MWHGARSLGSVAFVGRVSMKIDNRTGWETKDLRKVLVAILRHDEFVPPKGAVVRVVASRGKYSGWATYGGRNSEFERTKDASRRREPIAMLLRIPAKGPLDVNQLAGLIWHEVGHWRGLRHGQMGSAMMRPWDFRITDHGWARVAFEGLTVRAADRSCGGGFEGGQWSAAHREASRTRGRDASEARAEASA